MNVLLPLWCFCRLPSLLPSAALPLLLKVRGGRPQRIFLIDRAWYSGVTAPSTAPANATLIKGPSGLLQECNNLFRLSVTVVSVSDTTAHETHEYSENDQDDGCRRDQDLYIGGHSRSFSCLKTSTFQHRIKESRCLFLLFGTSILPTAWSDAQVASRLGTNIKPTGLSLDLPPKSHLLWAISLEDMVMGIHWTKLAIASSRRLVSRL